MKQEIQQAGISTFTTGAGIATVLKILPAVLGSIATLAGIMLSGFLIRKVLMETKKVKIEMIILRQREKERLVEIEKRKNCGASLRRKEDD